MAAALIIYYSLLISLPLHFLAVLAIRRERIRNRKILMGLWKIYPTRRR